VHATHTVDANAAIRMQPNSIVKSACALDVSISIYEEALHSSHVPT